MRDVKIKATPVGNAAGADDVSFTVLWVDVVVATSGKISPDNDKINNYKNWTANKTDSLGLQHYSGLYGERIGWGVESRGKVYPSDFAYPGSDLQLDRDVERRYYVNEVVVAAASQDTSPTIPPGNDRGSPSTYDSNPLDSKGFIYEFDAAGIGYSIAAVGTTVRTRKNHNAFASITIGGTAYRASGVYAYFFRLSIVKTGPADKDWKVIVPADIPGDNLASGPDPARTKLSIAVQ